MSVFSRFTTLLPNLRSGAKPSVGVWGCSAVASLPPSSLPAIGKVQNCPRLAHLLKKKNVISHMAFYFKTVVSTLCFPLSLPLGSLPCAALSLLSLPLSLSPLCRAPPCAACLPSLSLSLLSVLVLVSVRCSSCPVRSVLWLSPSSLSSLPCCPCCAPAPVPAESLPSLPRGPPRFGPALPVTTPWERRFPAPPRFGPASPVTTP